MRSFMHWEIQVVLQDVFLSDTPLSLRSSKTPLQGETPRPDLSDRLLVKPAVNCSENFVKK